MMTLNKLGQPVKRVKKTGSIKLMRPNLASTKLTRPTLMTRTSGAFKVFRDAQ
jgi:hypothetical protein